MRVIKSTYIQLGLVAALALAITLPFVSQPFTHDEPLMIDFAEMQVDTPFQQHLPDYDYYGVHFDRFFQTHPRLQSFYLSLVLRAIDEPSEVPIHGALVVFPVMAGVGMFYLGRRFGVNGLAAAALLLVTPAFFVSSHLAMVDVPGVSLWIASLAAFIYGVDRDKAWLLALSGLLFLMAIFTFFQALAALALAFFYLALSRKWKIRYLLPLIVPALIFAGYLIAFVRTYGEPPRFSYRKTYEGTVVGQLRGVVTILGGVVFFPPAVYAIYWRNWRAGVVFLCTLAATAGWSFVKFAIGDYAFNTVLLLCLMIPAGVMIVYLFGEGFSRTVLSGARRSREGKDVIFLVTWLGGVLFYCVMLLPYPSPRYILPAVPAVVIMTLLLLRLAFSKRKVLGGIILTGTLASTLALSAMIGMADLERAEDGVRAAEWAISEYGADPDRLWFNGELGYRHYMERGSYRMLPNIQGEYRNETSKPWPEENPEPGDVVANATTHGGWFAYPEVMTRMWLREIHYRDWRSPIVVFSRDNEAGWASTTLLPYNLKWGDEPVELVAIWDVVEESTPIPRGVVDGYPEDVRQLVPDEAIYDEGDT